MTWKAEETYHDILRVGGTMSGLAGKGEAFVGSGFKSTHHILYYTPFDQKSPRSLEASSRSINELKIHVKILRPRQSLSSRASLSQIWKLTARIAWTIHEGRVALFQN
jgi:hypothetical protein